MTSPEPPASRPAKPDSARRRAIHQVGRVLRRARQHHSLSLREVERRTGRSNAYLSQVERGVIKQPDPVVLLELADLYGLNFELLAAWLGWLPTGSNPSGGHRRATTAALVRQVLQLDGDERTRVLHMVDSILRARRT